MLGLFTSRLCKQMEHVVIWAHNFTVSAGSANSPHRRAPRTLNVGCLVCHCGVISSRKLNFGPLGLTNELKEAE